MVTLVPFVKPFNGQSLITSLANSTFLLRRNPSFTSNFLKFAFFPLKLWWLVNLIYTISFFFQQLSVFMTILERWILIKKRENVPIKSKRKAFHTLLQNTVFLVMSSHLQTLSSVVNRELKHGRRRWQRERHLKMLTVHLSVIISWLFQLV